MSAIVVVCALAIGAQESAAQTLPSGWTSRDIGSTGGSASSSNGTWSVSGSGANIWDAADAFQFTYRSVSGDFDFSARLTAFDSANQWSKAGVMVREALTANAKNAYAMFSQGTGSALQYRAATGGTTARVTGAGAATPLWLRLVRQGTRFTAYSSSNGTSWTTVGAATISMAANVYVGFGVTSRDPAAFAEATFTNVALGAGAEQPATGTWNSADIGSPAVGGAFSNSGGTFMVSGAGADVWGTADQFRYAYQAVQGDVEIIARLATFTSSDAWAKAGVMVRQSTAAGAAHGFSLMSGGNGVAFQRRPAANGSSYSTLGVRRFAPGWVRLVREGNLFSAYESANGSTWTLVGTDTISMSGTILVGLAVTSHVPSAVATATFTNVTVRTPNAGTNQPPSVTLTAPSSGATYTAPATISFSASASDSDGSISRVDFYRGSTLVASDTTSPYTASSTNVAAGTYSLTAVAVDNEGASTTSAPVSVTVNGTTGGQPVVSFVSPSQGATFTAGSQVLVQAAASDSNGTISRVELYQGSTLLKSDTTSPYSVNWNNVPAGTHTLTARAYDNSGLSQAATVTITVNPAGNQLPTVSITSPTNGATFTAPATITVQATASDSDGSVSRVEFYRGSTLITTDTTAPYSASWASLPAGTYSITARAYDNSGASRTSAAVSVTVNGTTTQPTTVVFTASSNHATAVTSYVVAIYRAADPLTASPVATRDVGKPTPASNGDISVDISTLVNPLASGSYKAVVRAIGPGGTTASTPSANFSK